MDLQKGLQTNTGFISPLALYISYGWERVRWGKEQESCLPVGFQCHLPNALCLFGASAYGRRVVGRQTTPGSLASRLGGRDVSPTSASGGLLNLTKFSTLAWKMEMKRLPWLPHGLSEPARETVQKQRTAGIITGDAVEHDG